MTLAPPQEPRTDDSPAEPFRGELLGYCYRILGSYAEAEDAVQETVLRAWQRQGSFEGRSSVRTWVYRIATNICLDAVKAPQRRALPMDLSTPGDVPTDPRALRRRPEPDWVGPLADHHLPAPADPADRAQVRETVRLAFVTALQLLPPRQRAVLILRDVLDFSAAECAELLGSTVASVNSALARARATLAAADREHFDRNVAEEEDRRLLESYLSAFERYDIDALVELLHRDAVFSMPPYELWLHGADAIRGWWDGPGRVCEGSRTIATAANGRPALAVYHPLPDGGFEPFAVHVLEPEHDAAGRVVIGAITHFMGAAVFAEFGLPAALTAQGAPAS